MLASVEAMNAQAIAAHMYRQMAQQWWQFWSPLARPAKFRPRLRFHRCRLPICFLGFFFFLKNLLLSSWVVILEQRQTGSLVFFCFLALVKAELYIPVCVCVRPAWFLCLCFDTVKLTAAASNILVRLLKPAWLQGARFLRCCDVQGLT